MKFNSSRQFVQGVVLFFLLIAAMTIAVTTAQAQNSAINGNIFSAQNRQPVGDLYIELQDQFGRTLLRTRVNMSGTFFFRGLRAGTYNVKVLTFGTNFQEASQEVTLVSFPLGNGRYSTDIANVDIYLKIDPRKIQAGGGGTVAPGVIFAQEVPDEARKLYRKGVERLDDKKEDGLDSLKKAIEIFPIYYDALDRLGNEYVKRKQYEEAAKYLVKAVEVNPRSFTSFYSLGIVSYNLKNLPLAIEALREAIKINSQSINAYIFYGMILRIDGNFEQAEKALLQAKSLAAKNSSPVGEIHWQLALLYDKTARYRQAADELEQFLKIEPKAPNAEQIKKLIEQLREKAK